MGFLLCCVTRAEILPTDGDEVKQLKSMGYELDIEEQKNINGSSLLTLDATRLIISKHANYYMITRIFTIGKFAKDYNNRLEVLEMVNKLNQDFIFNISITTEKDSNYVAVGVPCYGDYNPKNFVRCVRVAETMNEIFSGEEYKKLRE